MSFKLPQPSEGELFLKDFFESKNIKAEPQYVLKNLMYDDKVCRIADFYLPKYKVYIEFQGLWNNSKEDRERYKEKMNIYLKNRIPCIYIYPENLGIISYVFHKRMLETLKNFGMGKGLNKYKLLTLVNYRYNSILWFLISIMFLIGRFIFVKDWSFGAIEIISLIIMIYNLAVVAHSYMQIYIKEKYIDNVVG